MYKHDNKKTANDRIVLITEDHIYQCAALFYDVFTHAPWNYKWLTNENTNRYFRDLLVTPKFHGFAYEQNNKIIGVCIGTINDYFSKTTYEIKEIFIDRKIQHKGIGSMLLMEIETILTAYGVSAITLFTHRHIPAYSFYIKNGYAVSEETAYFCKPLLG